MTDRRFVFSAAFALLSCLVAGASRADDAQTPDSQTPDPRTPLVRIPDGVQASPVASAMVTHLDPQCPGMASFRRDSISYTERANNRVVSNWTNTSETFVACVDADPNAPDPNGAETPP